jgi:plastocyanin
MPRLWGALTLVMVAAVACGGAKETGLPPGPTTPGTARPAPVGSSPPAGATSTVRVEVGDIFFRPRELTVRVGTRVVWTHIGNLPHSVTADDGTFDSHPSCPTGPCLQPRARFEFVFSRPGRFPYYCRVHGAPGGVGQSGVITVEAS